ncbi:phage tail protein [Antarcticirhabdus aurantiaca]|uniref:phage tail protein n=1 Tax=Antarcticirhabdus aurantiaca TaxID=2606717 RepID=UPI0034E2E7B7
MSGRLGTAPAAETIAALLADHGIDDADAAQVDAALGGYVAAGYGTARGEVEELLRLVGASASQSGRRLVFRSLASSSFDIGIGDLAEKGEAALIALRRAEADEAPDEVVVGFSDPARSYQPGAVSAGGIAGGLPRKAAIELPVVLAEEQAAGFALRHLRDALASRDTVRFALAPTMLSVEPGDRLVFRDEEGRGPPGRWLVTRIEAGEVLRVEARRLAEPGSGATRRQVGSADPSPPLLPSRAVVSILDLPLEGGGLRAAAFAKPWTPLLLVPTSEGQASQRLGTIGAPAVIGVLATALGPGPEAVIDRGSVLDVRLRRGGLESVSRERFLGGANLCAVLARNGAWELLQFETADEVEPMRFRVSGLVRAKGGTDDAMRAGAAAGAAFVVLDEAAEAMAAGVPRGDVAIRAVPAGRPLDDPAAVTVTARLDDRAGRPLSPVHLRGRFATDGTLALSWVRRGRRDADGWDGLDVPLGEEAERYRVRAEAEAGGELVLDAESPRLDLTASAQMAAFDYLPARLAVSVAQYGLAYGAGSERREIFHRPTA